MANNNNSAGRLYNILSAVKPTPVHITCRNAWASYFSIVPTETATLLQVLAKLLTLVTEAKKEIGHLAGVRHELYLAPFDNIEGAFASFNLEVPWNNFVTFLDATTMLGLEFAADTLALQRPETTISQEKLTEIQAEVEALTQKIVASSLPIALKTLLLENLEKIRRAILDYRITGVAGLSDVVDGSFGSTIRYRDEIKEGMDKSDENKEIFAGFFKIVGNLSGLMTFASTSYKLFAPIFDLPALPTP